ncbi:hypothetical protein SK355_04830 [Candidatus Fukatsuia symbiotica]|uniref:Uncharacterized protein n=1 Tax=Candidatus Fukatsuia symbiotica TaxID=1878942 RepID=A0A2U8I5E5_9GAMM|nr:hypothetical protein [Candidatus Fukatsuia symbiotica]AWK14352.1 hypothetical protein CCS41_07505 [Candidatus Fukatsuia symbiotica]MEA9444616.1 hypothetical protein [Candidatus Fukatsuia symbiotica]
MSWASIKEVTLVVVEGVREGVRDGFKSVFTLNFSSVSNCAAAQSRTTAYNVGKGIAYLVSALVAVGIGAALGAGGIVAVTLVCVGVVTGAGVAAAAILGAKWGAVLTTLSLPSTVGTAAFVMEG